MDCVGLASELERVESIRHLCREKGLLLVPAKPTAGHCDANRANTVHNIDLVRVCCERLGRTPNLKLPYLEALQEEISEFFKKIHVQVSWKIIYRSSVELKRLLSWLKQRANKKECTKETGLLFGNLSYSMKGSVVVVLFMSPRGSPIKTLILIAISYKLCCRLGLHNPTSMLKLIRTCASTSPC